jgi:hypothetical protein
VHPLIERSGTLLAPAARFYPKRVRRSRNNIAQTDFFLD